MKWTSLQDIHFVRKHPVENQLPCSQHAWEDFMNNKCDKSIPNAKIEEDRFETISFIPYIGLPSIIFSKKLRNYSRNIIVLALVLFSHLLKWKIVCACRCSEAKVLSIWILYIFVHLYSWKGLESRNRSNGNKNNSQNEDINCCFYALIQLSEHSQNSTFQASHESLS